VRTLYPVQPVNPCGQDLRMHGYLLPGDRQGCSPTAQPFVDLHVRRAGDHW
jgi:hypothetical protein